MKKQKNTLISLFIRYILSLILALNLNILYLLLTPITIYCLYFLLSLFFQVTIQDNFLILNNLNLEIIKACVAGSAYLLLILLNLTTPMNFKKRIFSLLFSIILFFILNILRIFSLTLIYLNNGNFELYHNLSWYFLSTLFVVLIWFFCIWLFKIKSVPVYTDIKKLIKLIKKT